MTRTYRETILETLHLSLASVTGGQPGADPYPFSFSEVVRGPLPQSTTKRLSAAVVPMKEQKKQGTSFVECWLEVSVDYRYRAQAGEVPATIVETVAGMIQRRLLTDTTLNGLAIDIYDVGNVVDLDHPEDLTAEGAVFFVVHYRHDLQDPRTYLGSFAPDPVAT
jgi:hypothetical protein